MESLVASKCLREKIEAGLLKHITKDSKKCLLWEGFFLVVDSTTVEPEGHVQCRSCKAFLSYNSAKTGTSHLHRHKCNQYLQNTSIDKSLFKKGKWYSCVC